MNSYYMNKYDHKKVPAKGSVTDVASDRKIPLSQVIMEAEAVILVDTSGSMSAYDGMPKTRYERSVDALEYYQKQISGKILVLSFSEETIFCPNGYPAYQGGSTNMVEALVYAKIADNVPDMNIILISDGEPNNMLDTLDVAKTFKNKINTVFIGPEDSRAGADFLRKLSEATGGQHTTDYRAANIKKSLGAMLLLEG